ncbi:hypothetical protein BJX76DRAFT_4266 [Aspergillus varians]
MRRICACLAIIGRDCGVALLLLALCGKDEYKPSRRQNLVRSRVGPCHGDGAVQGPDARRQSRTAQAEVLNPLAVGGMTDKGTRYRSCHSIINSRWILSGGLFSSLGCMGWKMKRFESAAPTDVDD